MTDALTAPRPDFLDLLRDLVAQGVPVFANDVQRHRQDIFCASFYAVRSKVYNAAVLFPNAGSSFSDLEWIVDSDDFGNGDAILHLVNSRYEPANDKNKSTTSVVVTEKYQGLPSLIRSDEQVLQIWERMQRLVSQDMPASFDPVEWYHMMTDPLVNPFR